jgi:hypothetical protein
LHNRFAIAPCFWKFDLRLWAMPRQTSDRIEKGKPELPFSFEYGAGEESRTLDLNLGKVALYQLSYSRMEL